MTIKEAMKAGLVKIRKSGWNEFARLELTKVSYGDSTGNLYGPWATVHDPASEAALNTTPTRIMIVHVDDGANDWEMWTEEHERILQEHEIKMRSSNAKG